MTILQIRNKQEENPEITTKTKQIYARNGGSFLVREKKIIYLCKKKNVKYVHNLIYSR